MSILYEYKVIKQRIGKEKFNQIQKFLDHNKQYCLADVYYKKDVWNEMEYWIKNQKEGEQS